jgi:CMP/dCMP kinase
MENNPLIIAVDGPAASGKSTLGDKLANYLGYLYFDTGIMYRAVTWAALKELGAVADEKAVSAIAERIQIDIRPSSRVDGRQVDVIVDGVDITWEIRKPDVNANVSQVSTYRGVRQAMTAQQRKIGLRGRVVMVGRDIGTVVLPEADLKIYLEASVEERAHRRFYEEKARKSDLNYDEILANVRQRDQIDSGRDIAPLKPAEDAYIVPTDAMDADQVFDYVKKLMRQQSRHNGKS